MILGIDGSPTPPTSALARLEAIDSHLGLKFHERWDGKKYWVLTYRWPLSDQRWSMVQRGEMAREDAFDVFCYVPLDCPVDEIPAYCEKHFIRNPKTDNILQGLRAANKKQTDEVANRIFERALDTNMPQRLAAFFDKGNPRPVSVPAQIS